MCSTCSQILPGGSVKYKVLIVPQSPGKKVLMACLDCPLLRQVTNQLEIEVVKDEWPPRVTQWTRHSDTRKERKRKEKTQLQIYQYHCIVLLCFTNVVLKENQMVKCYISFRTNSFWQTKEVKGIVYSKLMSTLMLFQTHVTFFCETFLNLNPLKSVVTFNMCFVWGNLN